MATQWTKAMHDAIAELGGRTEWLNRGDLGLGHEAIMAWPPSGCQPHYLFKLKLTGNVRRAMAVVRDHDWKGPAQGRV